jgi:acyl-CoA thioesterase II
MGDFEADTRVERSNGRARATLSQDWEVWGPNGGYLAAIALRAAGLEAKIKRPASFSGHFLRVARFEPVDLEVTTVQRGRRSESIHVLMRQGEKPILQAVVRTALPGPGLEHDAARMPDVPPPESLKTYADLFPDGEPPYRFWYNLETRIIDLERALEPPPRKRVYEPRWLEWYRFQPRASFDDPFVDAGRQLLLLDTLAWPAACQPHAESTYQAPNLDVTAWFHQPADGSEWLLADYDSPIAKDALMGTSGRIWSRDGRLLASGGAQLLCVPIGAGVPPPSRADSEAST